MENRTIFEEWKNEGEMYVGLKSVFWAQRMSLMVREVLDSTSLLDFSTKISLLNFCKENYDIEKMKEE